MSTYTSPGTTTGSRMTAEGGRNINYDLLGTNSEFKKIQEYVYYKKGSQQIIELPYPAFALAPSPAGTVQQNGIVVEMLNETLGEDEGSLEPVVVPYDTSGAAEVQAGCWREVDEDETSMSKAYLLWNRQYIVINGTTHSYPFNGVLTKKIVVKLNAGENLRLRVTYQAFFKDLVDSTQFRTEDGPVYTKELGKHILDKLDELDLKTTVMTRNMFGNTMQSTDILLEDLSGIDVDNRVDCEIHEVNTTAGKTLLAPAKGSFYPGTKGTDTEFRMHKYKVALNQTINEQEISGHLHEGWMFIYTENQLRSYEQTSDVYFLSNRSYFYCSRTGSYVRITDYVAGETKVTDWITSHSALLIEPVVYNLVSKIYDPEKGFTDVVNDTSAVITKEHRVIITADNVSQYKGITGDFVDVSLASRYAYTSDTTFQEGTKYYLRSGTVGHYIFTEAVVTVGDPIPPMTYFNRNEDPDASTELILGTDYQFTDVNLAKTEKAYTDQPVYDHVRLLTSLVTDPEHLVGISYQAFGGLVTPNDVRNIRQDLTNALEILSTHHLLTADSLSKQTTIKDLTARIRRIESYHDHFMKVEHTVYKGAGGFHWINIAQLCDLTWMTQSGQIKEIGTFRVTSKEKGWSYEFVVTVDLSKWTTDPANVLKVKYLGALGSRMSGSNPYSDIGGKETIGLRVCWNDDDGMSSGCILQLGWDYDKYYYDPTTSTTDVDVVTVVNRSGDASAWKLYYDPLESTQAAEGMFNVYGHAQYVTATGIYQAGIPYFERLQEYVYYKAGSTYAQADATYFKKDEITQTYDQVDIPIGTELASLEYTVYERSAYITMYRRIDVVVGESIPTGVYKINEQTSYSDSTFTFPNGDVWDESNPEFSHWCESLLNDTDNGIEAWHGNYPLAAFSMGPGKACTPIKLHSCLSDGAMGSVDASKVTRAAVCIYDRKNNVTLKKTFDMTLDTMVENTTSGETIFFLEDMCVAQMVLQESEDSEYTYAVATGLAKSGVKYYYKKGDKYFRLNIAAGESLMSKYYSTSDLFKQTGKTYYERSGAGTAASPFVYTVTTDTVFQTGKTYFEFYGDLFIRVGTTVYDITLSACLGTSSQINDRFDLRQIWIYF